MTARKISIHEDRFDTKGVTIAFTAPTPHDPMLVWACADHPDPDLFHPTDQAGLAAAQASAPTAPCGSSASTSVGRHEYGVWGGVLLENGKAQSAVPRVGRPPKVGSAA